MCSAPCYDHLRWPYKRTDPLRTPEDLQRFERIVLPHLSAGYNLARWLIRNDHDAEDVVQDACVRAMRSINGYRGGDARAWLLTIVRNTCYTWMRRNHPSDPMLSTDPTGDCAAEIPADPVAQPEVQFIREADKHLLREGLEALSAEFREALVLRELEGFSYKEIADIADVPLGTVMSRLARARAQLQQFLLRRMRGEV